MSSMSGYINYIQYAYASNKGGTKIGDMISNPWEFGKVDEKFTGQAVVESVEAGKAFKPAWNPIVKSFYNEADKTYYELKVMDINGDFVTYANLTNGAYTPGQAGKIAYQYDNVVIPQNDLPQIKAEMKSIALVAKARRIAIKFVA